MVLPEIHDVPPTFDAVTSRGYTTYNFALPGLILHALLMGKSDPLRDQLRRCPPNQVTMLDCHDGIPIQPDLVGILYEDEMRTLVSICEDRGANLNRVLGAPPGVFDAHQVNITYPSACGSEAAYLTARAIQLFLPGTPQIYYVGLLGGLNDHPAVADQGDGRAINRHNYTLADAREALAMPVARAQIDLLRLRNTHPAFEGEFSVPDGPPGTLKIRWDSAEAHCELRVDLLSQNHEIDAGDHDAAP